MGSDNFINLDPSSDSEHEDEGNVLHTSNSAPSEADCGNHTDPKGVPHGESLEALGDNDELEEGEHVQDMDLESDSELQQPINRDRPESLKRRKEVEPEKSPANACTHSETSITASTSLIDDSPIAGVKRARVTCTDQQASVRVVYNSLSRESKKKLMELMQQWSEWHCLSNNSPTVNSKEALECGEETYFPALNVGSVKTSTVSFWVDNQSRSEEIKSIQLDNDSVPLYDRGYILGSTSLGGSADSERVETLEASRCFNCGSYSHALRECSKPRDNVAISSARKQHNAKRNSNPASRGPLRYYQKSKGKFDDLKPGFLSPETRECLGIGELDPPPWHHRMRELGYPPGYLDDTEDEDIPSGITIFAGEERDAEYEDGELPEKGDPVPSEKKMTVEFPGINAPIPENADHRRWTTPSSSFRSHPYNRPTRLLDSQREHYQRNDGPPGNEYSAAAGHRSSDFHRGHYYDRERDDGPPGTERGPGFAAHSYSPRHGTYDHNNSSHAARNLGRSFSDRGMQSPARYDGLPSVHSPHPHPSGRESPGHPYHSPSASLDRWAQGSPRTGTLDALSQPQAGSERQEHPYQHHRRPHRN